MDIYKDEFLTEINSGLTLIQKQGSLLFGSDAYLLAAYVRRQSRARCADLGSGSGVIPLLMLAAHEPKVSEAIAVELQPELAEMIGRNAELNRLGDRLRAVNADVCSPTLAAECGIESASLDIVVSNPPYMKLSGKQNEDDRKNISRHETHGGIGDFCKAASRLLKHGGLFYVVYRPDRLPELICALTAAKLETKRMTLVHARRELAPCLVLCEAKKGASPGCFVTAPLIMYENGTEYTPELERIYETGEFDEHYQRP